MIDAPPSSAFRRVLAESLAADLRLAEDWSLWRLYAVRGAGFPIDLLAQFSDSALSAKLAAVFDAEARLDAAGRALGNHLTPRLGRDRENPARPCHHALKALQKRRPRIPVPPDDQAACALANAYAMAHANLAAARRDYAATYPLADRALTDALREFAQREDVRAAIAWQNPTVLEHLTRYFTAGHTDDTRSRQYRRLVASYAQRYCAKNEQIGFFGPVGWGLIAGTRSRLVAGDEVVRSVHPYFEYWAVAALADEAARLAPHALAPQLSADVRVDVHGLVLPDAVLPLDALQREFLTALDGTRTVTELVATYAGRAGAGLPDAAAVHDLLAQLARNEVIDWRLPLPVTPDAGQALGAALAGLSGIDDFVVRWRALDAGRAALAHAPLAEAPARIARVNEAFERLAGTQARRLGGNAYAGRTPLYVDAVRDIELTLAETLFAELAPALAPVLASAQWFSQQLLVQTLEFVTAQWRELDTGAAMPLARLWQRLQEETATVLAVGEDVVEQLQEKWCTVLDCGHDMTAHERAFDVDAVATRARAAFALASPPWSGARFQAPDLMLATRDLDALARGEWCAVLGEIHPCTNLMMQTVTGKLCPVREEALAATARVQSMPELIPAIARDARGHRTAYSLELPHDIAIEHGASRSARGAAQRVRLAELVVRKRDSGLEIATLDGTRTWPLEQFFGPQLRSIGISRFKPLAIDGHLPRLRIGRLVLQRESWRIAREELEFTRLKDHAQRMLELRRWARTRTLPRYCFYRVPGELKPRYLDLESPVFCDLFADAVRNAHDGPVSIGEMLPDPSQCWLTDGSGRRYTAELRMAAHTHA